jgi:hypothetical protein
MSALEAGADIWTATDLHARSIDDMAIYIFERGRGVDTKIFQGDGPVKVMPQLKE